MDKTMMAALEADGEKLRALTGEDHGPHFVTRRCDNCLHMMQEASAFGDDPYFTETVCNLHIVAGGWSRMRVLPEAVCNEHEFDDLSDRPAKEPVYPSSEWPPF